MIRKIFTSMMLFVAVFAAISIIADLYYHHKLLPSKPELKGWTCQCDFRVFWIAGYKVNHYALSLSGGQAGKTEAVLSRSQDPKYKEDLEEYINYDRSRLYNKAEALYHFRYSPLVAFFMAPLALILYPSNALMVWFIFLNIAFLASLLLLIKQVSSDFDISRNIRYFILWGTFLVALKFYLMNISIGQCDVLVALLFVPFLMAYARDRHVLCGVIFALIIQFKMLFLPALLYFLFVGNRKLVLSALLGSLVLLFTPAAIIGFGKTTALLKDWMGILDFSVQSQILNPKNQSITYFIGKTILSIRALNLPITAGRLFYILSMVLTIFSYAALLFFKRSLRLAEDKKFKYLEISLLIIITLLFSPLVWTAHFMYLIIPAATMALFLSTGRKRKRVYAALSAFVVLSLISGTDLTRFIPFLSKGRFVNIALGTLFLTYALVYSYKRQYQRP